MDNPESRSNASTIVVADTETLAQRSSALVRRGLWHLSNSDTVKLVELGKALTSSLQLDQVLRVILQKVDELLGADTWYLLLFDESKQELYYELAVGKGAEGLNRKRVKVGQGVIGWAAANGSAAIVPALREDPRFLREVDEWPEIETQSVAIFPLIFQGQCLGLIGLVNFGSRGSPSPGDRSLVQAIADFAAIGINNAGHTKIVHSWSITDEHTGLYNARHFGFILDTEIYRSARYSYYFSLVFVDFLGLEDLMKTLSFANFNKLLVELGQEFKGVLRLIDFAFYYGDGEFVLMLPQTSQVDGRLVARRLHKLFKEKSWLRAEDQNLQLPASIAIASFPEDGQTKRELLYAVDEAMFHLKKGAGEGVFAAKAGPLPPL
jgi:diguanylate cyclase (GGDEF)-like protein